MIIFSKQNIHKWAFWRAKPRFLFCISSGLVFALGVTMLSFLIKLCGNADIHVWKYSFPVFTGSFVSGSLFSIILWYQNDDHYREWKKTKDQSS